MPLKRSCGVIVVSKRRHPGDSKVDSPTPGHVKARKVRPRGYDGAEQVLFNLQAEQAAENFRTQSREPHDDDDYAAFLNALARAHGLARL